MPNATCDVVPTECGFLGDYQGLVGAGPRRFLAFFVTADPGSPDDPTNVFSIEAP